MEAFGCRNWLIRISWRSAAYWRVPCGLLSLIYFPPKITSSGVEPSIVTWATSITDEDNAPKGCLHARLVGSLHASLHARLVGSFPQLRFSLPKWLWPMSNYHKNQPGYIVISQEFYFLNHFWGEFVSWKIYHFIQVICVIHIKMFIVFIVCWGSSSVLDSSLIIMACLFFV